MALTRTYSGSLLLDLVFRQVLSGDALGGAQTPNLRVQETWSNDGGTAPALAGWTYGALTIAAGGDILLADPTDPFGTFGDAIASDGLTASGKKLKLLYLRNTHATASFKVVQKNANGLLLFDKTTGQTIAAGGQYLWKDPVGGVLDAITTASNDGLTLSLPGAASSAIIVAVWGS